MPTPSGSATKVKRTIPRFKSETEEARWWDKQGPRIAQDFEAAIRARTNVNAVPPALARATAAAKNVTIRLSNDDLEKARRLSQRRGLRYQTYVKMLLHQALEAEERRLA
jgi:predicted DNA binding CopG/RHH family protein